MSAPARWSDSEKKHPPGRTRRGRLDGLRHFTRQPLFRESPQSCSKTPETVAYSRFPKLELVCDCARHLILCAYATIGPMGDPNTFRNLLFGTLAELVPVRSWPTRDAIPNPIIVSRGTDVMCAASFQLCMAGPLTSRRQRRTEEV
jgi:hypothetical protein